MKIYQIHEYGGEWEDAYDCIHSTYIDKTKAESEMEKLIEKAADCKKCMNCPACGYCPPDCNGDCGDNVKCNEIMIEYAKRNCEKADISVDEDLDLVCKNKIKSYRSDSPMYRIEECEVIE